MWRLPFSTTSSPTLLPARPEAAGRHRIEPGNRTRSSMTPAIVFDGTHPSRAARRRDNIIVCRPGVIEIMIGALAGAAVAAPHLNRNGPADRSATARSTCATRCELRNQVGSARAEKRPPTACIQGGRHDRRERPRGRHRDRRVKKHRWQRPAPPSTAAGATARHDGPSMDLLHADDGHGARRLSWHMVTVMRPDGRRGRPLYHPTRDVRAATATPTATASPPASPNCSAHSLRERLIGASLSPDLPADGTPMHRRQLRRRRVVVGADAAGADRLIEPLSPPRSLLKPRSRRGARPGAHAGRLARFMHRQGHARRRGRTAGAWRRSWRFAEGQKPVVLRPECTACWPTARQDADVITSTP